MFNLYDIVRLKKDRPDIKVNKNNTGTVIDIIKNENVYTVEFIDENNEAIEESIYVYFKESDLMLVEPYDKFQPLTERPKPEAV